MVNYTALNKRILFNETDHFYLNDNLSSLMLNIHQNYYINNSKVIDTSHCLIKVNKGHNLVFPLKNNFHDILNLKSSFKRRVHMFGLNQFRVLFSHPTFGDI